MLTFVPISRFSYIKAFSSKETKLKADQDSLKIVFVGGSSLVYGVHSDLVQQSFPKFKVHNMGLHAGIGLKTMLDQVLPYIGQGDVIVVTPEYEQFISMFYGNSSGNYLEAVIDQPRYLKELDFRSLPPLIEAIPSSVHNRIKHVVKLILGKDVDHSIYSGEAFNSYGDMIRHKHFTSTKLAKDEYKGVSYDGVQFKQAEAALNYLQEFEDTVSGLGVTVLFAYPPMMKSVYDDSKPELAKFHHQLLNKGFTVLYPPQYSVFDNSIFLDTSYHLLYSSGITRTEALIDKMGKYIDG